MSKSICKMRMLCAAVTLFLTTAAPAASLIISSLPVGYTTSSIEIGQPYAGALAVDPANFDRLFVSVGFFGNQALLRVDAGSGTTTTVAGPFGSIGGIAVLSNGDLALTENGTSQTILRARDLTADGDYLDAGEITELISPILADSGFGFTGAQIAVAPAGNASAIPVGSLVIQTADGGTSGELLVVENPITLTPTYRPVGASYFAGLSYNGGIAFDATGNIVVGESIFPNGRIHALVNTNADDNIDAGESNILVDTPAIPNGIADLAASQDGRVFSGGNGSGFGTPDADIRAFQLPGNLLTGTGTPASFAATNSTYISTLRFDDPSRNFTPGATINKARLLVGGLSVSFAGFTNLVAITPSATSAVHDWRAFE